MPSFDTCIASFWDEISKETLESMDTSISIDDCEDMKPIAPKGQVMQCVKCRLGPGPLSFLSLRIFVYFVAQH